MQDRSDEKDIIQRSIAGDCEAFRILVTRYQARAFSLAFELLRSREDAEDVTQESFVKAYLGLADFKGEGAFYTWFYRIVYNMALDFKRKVKRRGGQSEELDESIGDSMAMHGSSISAPHEALREKEELAILKASMNSLSDEHKTVILLREVEGLNYDEIAQVTGISRGTVMSRLHYARKSLQQALERRDSGLKVVKDEDLAHKEKEMQTGLNVIPKKTSKLQSNQPESAGIVRASVRNE